MSDEVQEPVAPTVAEPTGDLFDDSWETDALADSAADEMEAFHRRMDGEEAEPEETIEEPAATETEEVVVEDEPVEPVEPIEATEPALPETLMKEIRRRIPGVIESEDDFYQHLDRLSERNAALEQIEQLYESNPTLLQMAQLLGEGKDFSTAALSLIDEVDPEPNIDENPREWAQWDVKRKEALKVKAAQQHAAQEAEQKRRASAEQVTKHYEEFVRAQSLSDEDATQYAKDYTVLMKGDPVTGKRRRDEHDVIYRGLNFEKLMKEREAAIRAEYEGKLKPSEPGSKLKGDGLPRGGGGKAPKQTPEERQTQIWRERHVKHNDMSALDGDWKL